jgi:hypothetical protein
MLTVRKTAVPKLSLPLIILTKFGYCAYETRCGFDLSARLNCEFHAGVPPCGHDRTATMIPVITLMVLLVAFGAKVG